MRKTRPTKITDEFSIFKKKKKKKEKKRCHELVKKLHYKTKHAAERRRNYKQIIGVYRKIQEREALKKLKESERERHPPSYNQIPKREKEWGRLKEREVLEFSFPPMRNSARILKRKSSKAPLSLSLILTFWSDVSLKRKIPQSPQALTSSWSLPFFYASFFKLCIYSLQLFPFCIYSS